MVSAATTLAERIAPFDLPALSVQDVFGFLALRETAPSPPLQALADACVEHLDPFRAPPSETELARRRRANLTARQDAMLVRWGYPYVFDTWFFHLTLTRRLSAVEKQVFMPAAETYFARAIATPRRVTDICLFVQPAPGRTVRHPGASDAARLRHRDNQVRRHRRVLSLRLIVPRNSERRRQGIETLAPGAGLEPATQRLTAACSTN